MSEATIANSVAILKRRYPNGVVAEAYENNTLFSKINKVTDFDGESYTVAIRSETPQGASAVFGIAQANVVQSIYNRFLVNRVYDYSVARIRGDAMKAAEKSTGALLDLWESEMEGANHTSVRATSVAMYRDGSGIRGVVGSISGNTITLGTASDVTNFAVGMNVQFVATGTFNQKGSGSHTATPPGNQIAITAIDRAAGTITFGSSPAAAAIGAANTDYIVRSGDNVDTVSGAVITGLQGWVPGGSTPGTLFGFSRNSDPVRYAGQLYNSTTVPMHEALIEASARAGVEGGRPTDVYAHPRDVANMKKSLDAKVQYNRVQSAVAGVSFSGIEIEGDNGKITVNTDMNCPRNTAFLGSMSSIRMHSLGPAPRILDFDGVPVLRVSNDDVYEVRIGAYYQMELNRPVDWVQITNWGA